MNFRIIYILILSTLLDLGCKQKVEQASETASPIEQISSIVALTEAQFKNAGINTAQPEKIQIGHIIKLNGKVEAMPENIITVSTPMGGFVRQLRLVPGTMVKKGQVLVKLEDKEYIQLQQDYLSAKNALAFAKLDFDRQSELSKNQAASDKVLQQADEKMKQQQILVKSLAEKLRLININPSSLNAENLTSQINIVAPASGMITDIMVNTGKYVQSGDAMVTVVASQGAKLVLKAFEKDLPYLRKGQKVITYSNIQPDKKMTATIENIVNQVGPEGFANIICNLSNSNSNIVPGMYLNADVEAQSIESWTIMDEAIVTYEGKEYVYIDKGNKNYEMVEVALGQKENGRSQIMNFESIVNKKVVAKGAYTLLMKMKNVEE